MRNLLVLVGPLAWLLTGCQQSISSSNRNINSHCVETVIGKDSSGHQTTTEDCDYDIDSKTKSTGF